MTKLSESEITAIHFYNQKCILENCRVNDLPLSVQSAALVFYKKFFDNMEIDDFNPKLLLIAIVLLACKSENIHGSFRNLLGTFSNEERGRIINYETLIATNLKFDFHIPSPYLRMFGYIVLLQEKGRIVVEEGKINLEENRFNDGSKLKKEELYNDKDEVISIPYIVKDINELWKQNVLYLDKIFFSHDINKLQVNTYALAALRLPASVFKGVFKDINTSDIMEIRRDTDMYNEPDNERILDAFTKLAHLRRP